MNIRLFYHSLLSDWNHGNAHFLRGITRELLKRGHRVEVFEPLNGWSYTNWIQERGPGALAEFAKAYPDLKSNFYRESDDPGPLVQGADLVIVHEWNPPWLIERLGRLKSVYGYRLLFHDTHHRSATTPDEIAQLDLSRYDGVLAFGEVIRNIYLKNRWVENAWTWHEAADTTLFRPQSSNRAGGDLVWIGNWGDNERTEEFEEFFIEPVVKLGLTARMYGVRYPAKAQRLLRRAGISYGGYLPSCQVPEVFSRYRFTVHVPRRAYSKILPGIPTIRPFEALACGIPLVSAPWEDSENLFRIGQDFQMVRHGDEMTEALGKMMSCPEAADAMSRHGRETVCSRHTCSHRVDELLKICEQIPSGAKGLPETKMNGEGHRAGHGAPLNGRRHSDRYTIAFFGSSLLSAYWNGAATYYRGLIKALHRFGHHTTFFEPDAFDRQKHRDIPHPPWAEVIVYDPAKERVEEMIRKARSFDIVVKASGVGVNDALLEESVIQNRRPGQKVIFWDVDAPATLAGMQENPEDPLRKLIPEYDLIMTYGGGQPVIDAYSALGARRCVPVNNALDRDTHHRVEKKERFHSDLSFLGNRLPDREERMDRWFFSVAEQLPEMKFLLGGSGWGGRKLPDNVHWIGHVYTKDHNAFNASPTAILNINRESMARMGFAPATRIFEAAGAGACIISDDWEGIEQFLEPEKEVLVAKNGEDVIRILKELTPDKAAAIGEAAFQRIHSQHTYQNRARKVLRAFRQLFTEEAESYQSDPLDK